MSKLISNHVKNCINRLKELNPKYLDDCLKQRLSSGIGSTTDFNNTEDLLNALMNANWKPWIDTQNVLLPGCTAFITYDISGHHGIIPLYKFKPDTIAIFKDFKHTGYLSLCIETDERTDVDYTILITGPEDGVDGDIMYTFHPGEPIPASTFKCEESGYNDGDTITVEEAIKLGFKTAKAE